MILFLEVCACENKKWCFLGGQRQCQFIISKQLVLFLFPLLLLGCFGAIYVIMQKRRACQKTRKRKKRNSEKKKLRGKKRKNTDPTTAKKFCYQFSTHYSCFLFCCMFRFCFFFLFVFVLEN